MTPVVKTVHLDRPFVYAIIDTRNADADLPWCDRNRLTQ